MKLCDGHIITYLQKFVNIKTKKEIHYGIYEKIKRHRGYYKYSRCLALNIFIIDYSHKDIVESDN